MLTDAQQAEFKRSFGEKGFAVAPGLFKDEAPGYIAHFMQLRESGEYPDDLVPADKGSSDPLRQYPRMIHMHRWDQTSLGFLVDPRIRSCFQLITGDEPYAVQTMLYFKPPGARGQALHQDQFYLQVHPGTCLAAWLALDDCDEANGCMQLVPGSHTLPLLCAVEADTNQSFTDVTVPLPEGMKPEPVQMKAGDVLFFNGQVIHGSYPNTTKDRFRRALIGHYVEGAAEKVGEFYHPVLRMDGSTVEFGVNAGGGPCGDWVNVDGSPVVAMRKQ